MGDEPSDELDDFDEEDEEKDEEDDRLDDDDGVGDPGVSGRSDVDLRRVNRKGEEGEG